MSGMYETRPADDEEQSEIDEGGEAYQCRLCAGRCFRTEELIEAHLRSKGHVEREMQLLKREQAKYEAELQKLEKKKRKAEHRAEQREARVKA